MRRRGARDRGVTAVGDGDRPEPGAALRPLAYGDLPSVLAIERRSFTTPWSLAMFVLETSCDDTCAAVLDGGEIRSNVISSQAAAHDGFGGVVPEIASRHHLDLIGPVVEAALDEAGTNLDGIDAIAVTRGPGMVGALLVGLTTAKALA